MKLYHWLIFEFVLQISQSEVCFQITNVVTLSTGVEKLASVEKLRLLKLVSFLLYSAQVDFHH